MAHGFISSVKTWPGSSATRHRSVIDEAAATGNRRRQLKFQPKRHKVSSKRDIIAARYTTKISFLREVLNKLSAMNGLISLQLEELGLAFILSALVGVEREIRQKSAGLRTHTLVGVSSALIMLVSKYGFSDVLSYGIVVLDPSRVAAQIVSGIGFIGGGVIFMRRDIVRGLTTAASIWFTAALGMACGAGLFVLCAATMLGYGIIMLVFPALARRLPQSRKLATDVRISFAESRGLLGNILIRCTALRFAVERVRMASETEAIDAQDMLRAISQRDRSEPEYAPASLVTLTLTVKGKRPVSHLIAAIGDMAGVRDVGIAQEDHELD